MKKMPGGDGRGPNGLGARTGRGLGYCSGYDTPGYTKGPGAGLGRVRYPMFGRGMAWGRGGGGRGYRFGGTFAQPQFYPRPMAIDPQDSLTILKQEKDFLESEAKNLQVAIQNIAKRIEEFDKSE